jgi:N-acetylneuraminic acid mutarotase
VPVRAEPFAERFGRHLAPARAHPTERYPAAAWTGRELVIAGGEGVDGAVFRDAAAYNPTTRTWRRLPPMPSSRGQAIAVWDGTEVLVAGGYGPGWSDNVPGLAYNPSSDRWRTLPTGDAGRAGHVAVWTGQQLLVWGGHRMRNGAWANPPHGMSYDPVADRWSALPVSPLRGRTGATAVWTGRAMIVWGGDSVSGDLIGDGAVYQP